MQATSSAPPSSSGPSKDAGAIAIDPFAAFTPAPAPVPAQSAAANTFQTLAKVAAPSATDHFDDWWASIGGTPAPAPADAAAAAASRRGSVDMRHAAKASQRGVPTADAEGDVHAHDAAGDEEEGDDELDELDIFASGPPRARKASTSDASRNSVTNAGTTGPTRSKRGSSVASIGAAADAAKAAGPPGNGSGTDGHRKSTSGASAGVAGSRRSVGGNSEYSDALREHEGATPVPATGIAAGELGERAEGVIYVRGMPLKR